MRRQMGFVGCITLLTGLICGTCLAQTQPTKPPPPPPLTRAQVESLIVAGVNRLDILNEASSRNLDFEVTDEVLTAWEKLTSDPVLLNNLPLYSTKTLAQVIEANNLMKSQKYSDAATLLGQVLQPSRSPRCTLALLLRARAFYHSKDFDRSQTDFVKFLEFDPNNVDVHLELATVLLDANKFPEAEKLLLQVLAEFPWKSSAVHAKLANLRGRNGQFSKAIDDLLMALQSNPADPEFLTRLALLHAFRPGAASQGDAAAREFAMAAVLLTPEDSEPKEGDPKLADVVKIMVDQWKHRRVWTLQASALLLALDGQFPAAKELQDKAATLAQSLGEGEFDNDQLTRISAIRDAYAAGKRFQFPSTNSRANSFASLDSKGAAQLLARRLIHIPGGKFQMGSTRGAPDEKPVREITVRSFRISSHEVTNAEWAAVMRLPLAGQPDEAHEMVSWEDCKEFIRRLNTEVSNELAVFRLPTEAEWEFAARVNTTTDFSFGDDAKLLTDYGWHDKNWKGKASPVGQLQKNKWELYDMYGNVAEWCQDTYGPYPGAADAKAKSESDDVLHVVRGGHRRQSAQMCRSSARSFAAARDRLRGLGFRLAADSNGDSIAQTAKHAGGPSPAGLLSIIDQANDPSQSALSPVGRRLLEAHVQLILGYVLLELQNETAALAAFEKVQNLATPPTGTDDRNYLVPNVWVLSVCSRAWIWTTSDNPEIRDPQRADALAKDANLQTRNSNWLPYVVRAAANAALKNWSDARKWEDNGLEQSKSPLSRVSDRVTNASRKRRELYEKNMLTTIRPLPFPLDEFYFSHP